MKNEENAIEVRDVTKTFKVYYDKGTELKEKLLFWKRNRYENRVVLDHISFEVKKGEAIGLVGKNGCGKSTTLKMLTRIIYPNSGEIEMCGRVSSCNNGLINVHKNPNTEPLYLPRKSFLTRLKIISLYSYNSLNCFTFFPPIFFPVCPLTD